MQTYKKERFASILQSTFNTILARDFHVPGALVTVLGVSLSDNDLTAVARIGIIPYEKELEAYAELKRREPEIRYAILKSTRLRHVPKFVFQIVQETNAQEKG
ncbi:MAG: ribosome-binding factor A [Nanoarchaeota archaeon]|nr:ribosome-binding factor A [Nanoarchaeota archaeon]